ncbi:MAG: hypothetical protein V7L25_33075 [Nostoc sp.]|uniref:hypothetical protein n=1 Tax=Nostoc sp. TaxID=1180 RepID=UPI002FF0A682
MKSASPFFATTLLLALIYKVLPDIKITWSNVWIGAAIASVLFTVGNLFSEYTWVMVVLTLHTVQLPPQ